MKKADISYIGIFTDHIAGSLNQDIPNQHVTLVYKPSDRRFLEALQNLGQECEIEILGYGNDGKNEGLLVEARGNFNYYGAEQQHITLSIADGAKAVDTGFLSFDRPIPDSLGLSVGDVIHGTIGAFNKKEGPIYDPKIFEEYERATNLLNSTKDAHCEIKDYLVAKCLNDDHQRAPIVTAAIDTTTMQCCIDGSKSYWIEQCDIESLTKIISDGMQVDLILQCALLEDSNMQPIVINDIQDIVFENGQMIAIGRDVIVSNIDFQQELQRAIVDRGEHSYIGEDGAQIEQPEGPSDFDSPQIGDNR